MTNTATVQNTDKNPPSDIAEQSRFPDPTAVISRLRPVNRLPKKAIESLASHAEKVEIAKQCSIIELIRDREFVYYLLDGKLTLFKDESTRESISGQDEVALSPLDRRTRGFNDLVCADKCVLAKLPWRRLEELLMEFAPNELDSSLEVKEILSSTSSDWMVRLLQSDLLADLPPSAIQEVMSAVEPLEVKKDEIIIRQGDDPDHFYIIETGSYDVVRQTESSARQVQLATLKAGDFFGEEALITGNKRGTSVKASTNGMLLKVHRSTFTKSIVEPTVTRLDADEAYLKFQQTDCQFIDVRERELFEKGSLPRSLNLVLKLLRINSNQLGKEKTYVTVADEPNAAALASFLLRVRGFDAAYLSVPLESFASGQDIHLVTVGGVESSASPCETQNELSLVIDERSAESELEEIDKLNEQHADKDDKPVDKSDYAHTVIGVGLADLIDELHGSDDTARKHESSPQQSIANEDSSESHLGEIHSQLSSEDIDPDLSETMEDLDRDDDDKKVVELDSARAKQHTNQEIDLLVEEKIRAIRVELEHEMQQELAKHKRAALKALKTQQQKLLSQFQARQTKLKENSKKLIALANKISQQKAEVEAARKSLRDALDKSAD